MYQKAVQSIYQEERNAGNAYRAEYCKSISALIADKKEEARQERDLYAGEIAQNREACRETFKRTLGWPLTLPARRGIPRTKQTEIFADAKVRICRMQFEIFPNFWFYGLCFEHLNAGKLPLVISQHGGLGTPELCSGFFGSANYNDMTLRIFQKGVNVFAPQLLLWKEGDFGEDSHRAEIDNDLRRLGGSIAALEIHCLSRCLDWLETWEGCNGTFGMIGLSYGGFYALYTAAVDVRIRAALDCSFFQDGTHCFGNDFAWFDCARRFFDAEVGALVYPRALRIEVGNADEDRCVYGAKEEFARLERYYAGARDNLSFVLFDGGHEFCPEGDVGIEWILKRL